ncbi:MAG: AAA family ATPase [Alphaproteobacteria bacterium]|nr:AAA family ATPase [Alphaproteobacteria bacterium]
MIKVLNYKSLELLYENNEIVVFRAEDEKTLDKVIIKSTKTTHPTLQRLAIFRHEYQINHNLDLNGIVHCRSLVESSDAHYLVFDNTDGVPLKKFLAGKSLSPELFLPIAIRMVQCLADLHSNNIIHKDIKPENILITPYTLAIKLLDLSIASQLSVENVEAVSVNRLEGSLPYMAPEQTGRMNKAIDYRCDYYSLGVTFYEMLTGGLPFISDDPLEYVHFHLAIEAKTAAEQAPLTPVMLSKITAKLMSKSPDDRYQSAAGLIADLSRCLTEWNEKKQINEFDLGEFEALGSLRISSKIYGRERDTEELLRAFDRAKDGGLECLMISGYSGVGKTTLINEIQKPITSEHGHFINGKFDQMQRTSPYLAFTSAFSKLAQAWLSEPEDKLVKRREGLLSALGQSAQVIIEFFPELELIVGKQPAIDKLPPEMAQNRFLFHFQSFMRAIASPKEPLVIFIDDLQWMDPGSLKLMELILTTQDFNSILFIGAYRDNEVDDTHPLMVLLAKLKKANVEIHDIELKPLELNNVNQLLVDTLGMDEKSILPLAKTLYEKTAGNPFFTREFLQEVYNQGLVTFSVAARKWQWDLEKIVNLPGSNNVLDLMLEKINKLTESSQRSLQLGSCVGMTFDSFMLSQVQGLSQLEIEESLSYALKEGLIQRTENGMRFKFIHDRIQQAAYHKISDKEKEEVHLAIGKILLESMGKGRSNTVIFEIMDHFRRCVDLIQDNDNRECLARLSLDAGLLASASGAYQASYEYLLLGIYWSRVFKWDNQYDLLWNLNLELIESLYLKRDSEEAMKLTHDLLEKAQSKYDSALVYKLQMKINLVLNKFFDNLKIHCAAADLFGLKLALDPTAEEYKDEFKKFKKKYGSGERFTNRILKIKRSTEKELVLLEEIIALGGNSGLLAGHPKHTQVTVIRCIPFFEKHGAPNGMIFQLLESNSRYTYINTGDLDEYSSVFKATYDFYQNNEFPPASRVNYLLRLMRIGGYFLNLKDMIPLNVSTVQDFVETGSFTWLPYSIYTDLELCYFADTNLNDLYEKAESYYKMGAKYRLEDIMQACAFAKLSFNHQMGDTSVLVDDVIQAMPAAPTFFGFFAVTNLYFSEDYKRAKELAEICFKENKWFSLSITPRLHEAMSLMILAQLYPGASESEKREYEGSIRSYCKKLEKTSKMNPYNFRHLYLMGQAEYYRLKNKPLMALDFYHQAIAEAKTKNFSRWIAMASERAGELYLELKDTTAAAAYFQAAIYYYSLLGCELKTKIINQKYGQILNLEGIVANSTKSSLSTSVMMSGDLDLLSMIKANQVISSEIKLDKLLPKILRVVIESAGADKVIFIGLQKDLWVIEAVGQMGKNEINVDMVSEILTENSDVPQELITYVTRSLTHLVIGDLSQDERYSNLKYVQEYKTKSALCLPIMRGDSIVAILYLENNLNTDVFSPERLRVLQALSTQISISLENARYFENMQQLFNATERFVPKKFLQLLGRKNIEEVQIGDSVKVEMSAIFADLRDFTTISESIEPEELTYILNTYLKYMAPIIRNNNGFINRVLGDGILALFPVETQDAVQASVEMQQALPLFNKEINEAGFKSIFMGIGVNTGPAMLCALGEEERIEANVVSDMVNAASRIEGLNKMYGTQLLISDATYNKLKDPNKFSVRKVDTIRVKGKTKAMSIYEILPVSAYEEQQKADKYIRLFEQGFELYKAGSFSDAKQTFEKCLTIRPEDSVAKLFKERCDLYLKTKTPENWDGITTMLEK